MKKVLKGPSEDGPFLFGRMSEKGMLRIRLFYGIILTRGYVAVFSMRENKPHEAFFSGPLRAFVLRIRRLGERDSDLLQLRSW